MPATALHLVVVGGIAGDPDGTDRRPGAVADQHAARHRDQRAADGVGDGGDEVRALGGHLADGARADPHGERAVRLADGDLGAPEAGAVLGRERLERAARVEHGNAERLEAVRPGAGKRGGNDPLGNLELHGHLLTRYLLRQ
jgi:hypothetical protein